MPRPENPNPSSLFERAGWLKIPVLLAAMSGLLSTDLKDKPEKRLNISDVLEEKDPENQAKYLEALLAKLSNTDIDQNVKQVLIQQYKDFPQDYSYQDKVFWFQDIFNKLNIDTSITIPTSELVIPDITTTFPEDQKESPDPRLAELRSRYEEMNTEPKGGDPVQTFLEEYRRASASYQTDQILKGVAKIGEQNQVEPTSNEPVVEKEREREFDVYDTDLEIEVSIFSFARIITSKLKEAKIDYLIRILHTEANKNEFEGGVQSNINSAFKLLIKNENSNLERLEEVFNCSMKTKEESRFEYQKRLYTIRALYRKFQELGKEGFRQKWIEYQSSITQPLTVETQTQETQTEENIQLPEPTPTINTTEVQTTFDQGELDLDSKIGEAEAGEVDAGTDAEQEQNPEDQATTPDKQDTTSAEGNSNQPKKGLEILPSQASSRRDFIKCWIENGYQFADNLEKINEKLKEIFESIRKGEFDLDQVEEYRKQLITEACQYQHKCNKFLSRRGLSGTTKAGIVNFVNEYGILGDFKGKIDNSSGALYLEETKGSGATNIYSSLGILEYTSNSYRDDEDLMKDYRIPFRNLILTIRAIDILDNLIPSDYSNQGQKETGDSIVKIVKNTTPAPKKEIPHTLENLTGLLDEIDDVPSFLDQDFKKALKKNHNSTWEEIKLKFHWDVILDLVKGSLQGNELDNWVSSDENYLKLQLQSYYGQKYEKYKNLYLAAAPDQPQENSDQGTADQNLSEVDDYSEPQNPEPQEQEVDSREDKSDIPTFKHIEIPDDVRSQYEEYGKKKPQTLKKIIKELEKIDSLVDKAKEQGDSLTDLADLRAYKSKKSPSKIKNATHFKNFSGGWIVFTKKGDKLIFVGVNKHK